ncbi:response regulator transcription factor [Faecalibaculum rodentium]|jgi:DNA-binding response OmpR family regulator|uniref:response regulator transcription factor n=1 Tax=Faecalibaculum rodentium TaxID=1702221 RepID=UPI001C3CA5D7|nr:response regulator transcription factor [Faecalibaculum rodentium]
MRILVIEDEETLARLIESRLKRENHGVDVALDGDTGLMEALRGIYDLIILDVMLPGTSGFDILSALKKQRISSKVIMLTARGALEDRLHGLKAGADDYVTKPFHLEELAARVSVQLRREEEGRRTAGDLELADQSNLLVCRTTGKSIELSAKELAVMDYLLSHPQQILSRDQILDRVWGLDSDVTANNLEAYLSFLRRKLHAIGSAAAIKAVRGLGYRLETGNA